jgi:hypothetical protein
VWIAPLRCRRSDNARSGIPPAGIWQEKREGRGRADSSDLAPDHSVFVK